jgi:hypothetical protein
VTWCVSFHKASTPRRSSENPGKRVIHSEVNSPFAKDLLSKINSKTTLAKPTPCGASETQGRSSNAVRGIRVDKVLQDLNNSPSSVYKGTLKPFREYNRLLHLFYNTAEAQRQSRNKVGTSLYNPNLGNRLSLSTLSLFFS